MHYIEAVEKMNEAHISWEDQDKNVLVGSRESVNHLHDFADAVRDIYNEYVELKRDRDPAFNSTPDFEDILEQLERRNG